MTTIIQLTDLHIPDINETTNDIDVKKNLTHTIESIRNEVFDILIVTGDIAFKQANAHSYECVKQLTQNICTNMFILGGNHDNIKLLQAFFPHSFPHNLTYYKIPNRDSTIICLDSSSSIINQQQLDWLQVELSHSQNVNIFIHHPILPTHVTYMESKYSLLCRNQIIEILEQHPYPISIFCGHFHTEDTTIYKHITQFITPSLLYQVNKYNTSFEIGCKDIGYRKIIINNQQVSTEVKWLRNKDI